MSTIPNIPNIPKITVAMHSILTSTANQIACTTHFVRRRSKLDGALFAQTLVFGWWSRPHSTLEELADTSAIPVPCWGVILPLRL